MDLNTDPPHLIPNMVEKSANGVDVVIAEVVKGHQKTILYTFFSKAFYCINNLVSKHKIDLNWSNFVCFSRKTVKSILQIKDRVRYLKYLQTDIGYTRETIRYDQINRDGRWKSKSFWNRFFFAIETLVSNSERLIRVATSLSLLSSIVSIGYLFYALAVKLFRTEVAEGWASTSIVLSVMFAVMFFILFIIGEYIALVYKETRKGPLYHVADEFNSSVLFAKMEDRNVI
jgi:dolichol-phosphate mannosyltransferase